MKKVGVLDYGSGNIGSLVNALRFSEHSVHLCSDQESIDNVDVLIVPGVGAFAVVMELLAEKNLTKTLVNFAVSGRKMLGICVGMQILATTSSEFGCHSGLDLISGNVERLSPAKGIAVPSVNWRTTKFSDRRFLHFNNCDFYFVHSYEFRASSQSLISATYQLLEQEVTAMVAHNNVFGVQFHPERSGAKGLEFLKYFIEM